MLSFNLASCGRKIALNNVDIVLIRHTSAYRQEFASESFRSSAQTVFKFPPLGESSKHQSYEMAYIPLVYSAGIFIFTETFSLRCVRIESTLPTLVMVSATYAISLFSDDNWKMANC